MTRHLAVLWAACLGGEGGRVNVLLMLGNNVAFSLSLSLSLSLSRTQEHFTRQGTSRILRKDNLSADGILSYLIE